MSYMFDEKGQIIIAKEDYDGDPDELMMNALDAGAEDFQEEDDSFVILTTPDEFTAVREAIEGTGITIADAEVTMLPQNYVTVDSEEDQNRIQRILDFLDEDDDVQEVFHNWDE